MSSYPTVLAFVFEGWAVGFAFAVCFHYAAKVFFSPKGIFRNWISPI